MSLKSIALMALGTGLATIASAGASGNGETTRYWDCCKGSCSWTDKASVSNPVTTCDASDNPLTDYSVASACNGGSAYMCSDQSPWAVNDTMAYGFAAVNIAGGTENSWCCSCYKLTFTSTSIEGKTMIVQATNTGADLGSNQFDLAIPGGGVGIYNACTDEFDAPASGWGAQYGGISTNTCSTFPTALQPGCNFRFDWFEGADNPSVTFEQVSCPAEITAKTGCVRDDDTSAAAASSDTSSAASSSSAAQSSIVASSSVAASSSSAVNANTAVVSSSSVSAVESLSTVASSASSVEYSSTVVASSAVESSSSAPVVSSSSAAPVASSSSVASVVASSNSAFIPGASEEACVVEYVYADDYDL